MAKGTTSNNSDFIQNRWEREQLPPDLVEKITDKMDTKKDVYDVLDILNGLNRDNCREKLFTFCQLLHEAWIRKFWWCYYKWDTVPTEWDSRVVFRDSNVGIHEDIFNNGGTLSDDYVTVNPGLDYPLLTLSQMKKGEDNEYWDTIIKFLNHNVVWFEKYMKRYS